MNRVIVYSAAGAVIFGLLFLVTLGVGLAFMGAILGAIVGSMIPDLLLK